MTTHLLELAEDLLLLLEYLGLLLLLLGQLFQQLLSLGLLYNIYYLYSIAQGILPSLSSSFCLASSSSSFSALDSLKIRIYVCMYVYTVVNPYRFTDKV